MTMLAEPNGESEQARIERLGRERPAKLASAMAEVGFVSVVAMSQLLTEYAASGSSVLVPTLVRALDIPESSVTWPVSAFSLVVASFLLPFGRLADIYGGFSVFIAGMCWFALWSLIGGFAHNELMLDFCRALQGLGAAAYLPASLNVLGTMYRPGPRKNVVFSIYGAMAPLGFFVGILSSGVCAQYIGWRWWFWIGAIIATLTTLTAWYTLPWDHPLQHRRGSTVKMDWLGSLTTAGGLILFVFAVTGSAHAPQQWATPYILVTFCLGIVILALAFYVEGWVAEQPLLPFEVFRFPGLRPFILGLLLCYGTCGLYLLYATLYTQNVIGVTPMQLVAWFVPMGLGGVLLAVGGGFFMHVVPGVVLSCLTGVAIIIMSLLFALAPPGASYWAWFFPAMLCATLSIDLIFNAANVFLTTILPARQQGLAGALSNVVLQLSIAVLLGFADVVAAATAYQGLRHSYQNVFWFEFACGCGALITFAVGVRIPRAKSDLTADEKEQLTHEENVTV